MKAEKAKLWREALTSGEYEQTRGCLRNKHGFCCMGVICDLHAKETGAEWTPIEFENDPQRYLNKDAILPRKVMDWAGIKSTVGGINIEIEGIPELFTTLTAKNDSGATFKEIADLIEQHEEAL